MKITGECEHCNATIEYWPCQPRRFCSRACARAGGGKRQRDPANWRTTTCPTCGESFDHERSERRTYCSDRCKGRALVKNLPDLTPSAFETACEQCGDTFTTRPSSTRGRFCSRRCWGDWLAEHGPRGAEHPNWRGGHEPYYGSSWPLARRRTRQRDRVCQDCGISPVDHGRALDVHHLVPFRTFGLERHEEANRLDNLVALCSSCHMAREWAGRAVTGSG